MKMIIWVKYVCIFSVVCMSHFAHGALITRNDFSLDTSTNIITGNGLNWTRWDTLAGVSINQALTSYSEAGWRLASSDEMIGMYSHFISGIDWHSAQDENSEVSDFISVDDYQNLVAIFGVSQNAFGGISNIMFGNDLDNDGAYRSAGAYYTDSEPAAGIYSDNSRHSADFSASDFSVQLVRAINVSEPKLFLLVMCVLLFLGMSKCKSTRL
ncbi:hypothetical protein FX988_01641 [Paraglaciecola mesophila]|uniref:DUF1566 domain-containing protein n=1 Tax=Paraglaciecola mesophila TaxID=197222 RepID=A0A857JJD9_9ALTE|nr:hypothetical protein [Paraglaciecola mesophila]QHJ11412.1 hypothetical protein FX988_01641 [Paraglaciecola mesophila]